MKSIVSYPERGEGGNNKYRGNCSPKLIEDLIDQFHVENICDYMAGSFTTADAAKAKGITSRCYDLNHGFDLMTMDLPERSEFTFWHPPYWNIITYSDNMYKADDVIKKYGFDPRINDLSRAKTWEEFVKMQNYCMMKLYSGLETGGRLAVLMGDIKKSGRLYSQICDIVKPGTMEQIVIKAQHNCFSDKTEYSNRNFIPICHEYLLIVRKDMPLIIQYSLNKSFETDIRDIKASSWRDVVREVLESIGHKATLSEIYAAIEPYKKAKRNPHWKEKVRQTLQINRDFVSTERGIWGLTA